MKLVQQNFKAMETIQNKQLAEELQELYLENKQTLSDVLFLEDEMRFFNKLFDKVITLAVHQQKIAELHPVNKGLIKLKEKRQMLKDLILKHQNLLGSLINDSTKKAGLELIAESTQIAKDIKLLFLEEKEVRKNLYMLAEQELDAECKTHLLGA